MQRLLTLLVFLGIFSSAARAQEECAATAHHNALLAKDPAYAARWNKMKADWSMHQKLSAAQRLIITGSDTVYEVPVVVHIIHRGEAIGTPNNPSDAYVQSSIDFMNETYAATYAPYPNPSNGGVYVPIKFVLAKRDPFCQPTTGIVRVDGSGLPGYSSNGIEGGGAADVDVKDLSRWPNDKYYNIWVVWNIDNGAAGYAYYPGAPSDVDGTVVMASYLNAPSTTLTHELGHGLGLPHTFEGDNGGSVCPPNADCTVDGDGICDTEPHMSGLSCSATINPCTNAAPGPARNSFMSYSHGCRDRFSAGQRDRMTFSLRNARTALMNSEGSLPPPGPTPVAAVCTPTIANTNSTLDAGPRTVVFNTISRASGGYTTEDYAWLADFCNGRTDVYEGASYPVSITTGPQAENVAVYLDLNGDAQFTPAELMYSHSGSAAFETHTGFINIPASGSLLCTPLRMRVLSDVATAPMPTPCGVLQHGQGEDYGVTIKAPNTATLTAATPTNPFCYHDTVVFSSASVGVPTGAPIWWRVNGVNAGTGPTFSIPMPTAGTVVQAITIAPNSVCASPDTIRATPITLTLTPSTSTPPVISYIGANLVANTSPVQWYFNGVAIPGATSATYTPSIPGNYYAAARTQPCWSMPSNILHVSLLDIRTTPENGTLRLYPNPARDAVTLESVRPLRDGIVTFYNSLGQEVRRTSATRTASVNISLEGLSAGMYLVRVQDGIEAVATLRLVVAR